eukprot:TRINITY_DN39447_c0_g1_i1.p1 TRINITY_DN39447_c0_g1~~TRINITY_DN39447_c0_g1_i1.p1  ORF type:complete len:1036 (-),score=216.91 TRINITY_DN39447_c0_g1_i1:33-3140(-)
MADPRPASITLPEDQEEASRKYFALRQLVRNTFESFLRSLNSQSLQWLEQQFEHRGGDLNSGSFLRVFARVCPRLDCADFPRYEERKLAVHLAVLKLFQGMDVDQSGEASWMEFVEFISAVAEELRLKAQELSGQIFEFDASQIVLAYRPTITKCHYDKLFYWPEHPMECAVLFEEGQAGFYLHRYQNMQRRRRVDGHQSELLAACFMPEPFNMVVTAGNDKMMCFWDSAFNLVKRWSLKEVVGVLCWCPEINALYAADHFTERFWAWRIKDELMIKTSGPGPLKTDKGLEFKSGHTKAVQAMKWLQPLQCLATASLDTTVQLFDLVLLARSHVLQEHTKGLTCLEFCPMNQMLLSAGFDNYIAIWDPSAGTLSHKLIGHECSIAGICKMPDTDYEFMSVDFDGIVRLWDVRRLCCIQSFPSTDRRAEEAGELERLETRTLCPLGRDRVVISGRRLVVFDRDASDPKLTADWPINAVAFNHRLLEIVTPIKNDLYVWDALTGERLQIHDNVVEGNITAMSFGLGERRIFLGADNGEIACINAACGALLKTLSPHKYEVTQIESLPGKVLTLSSPEKVINIHDDNDGNKAVLLKSIDVSAAGVVLRMCHNFGEMVTCASEDGDVFWYNMDFAKQVSDTSHCAVKHDQAVSTCQYFQKAPLIVSADAEGCALFWSVPPLRTYDFFNKVILDLSSNEGGVAGITSVSLSYPDETHLYVGSDRGGIACVDISVVVNQSQKLQSEILARKQSGEAAEVISGRIFDSMPRPVDSPDYVFELSNLWFVETAHKNCVDRIICCKREPPVLVSLGGDACVRIWEPETGACLGCLEQGLPEGLTYERETLWRFPLDPHLQVQADIETLAEAAEVPDDYDDTEKKVDKTVGTVPGEQPSANRRKSDEIALMQAVQISRPASKASSKEAPPNKMKKSSSTPAMAGHSVSRSMPSGGMPSSMAGLQEQDYSKTMARYLMPRKCDTITDDWYAGPVAPGYGNSKGMALPRLSSGLSRPAGAKTKKVLEAARQLALSLNAVDTSRKSPYF